MSLRTPNSIRRPNGIRTPNGIRFPNGIRMIGGGEQVVIEGPLFEYNLQGDVQPTVSISESESWAFEHDPSRNLQPSLAEELDDPQWEYDEQSDLILKEQA